MYEEKSDLGARTENVSLSADDFTVTRQRMTDSRHDESNERFD